MLHHLALISTGCLLSQPSGAAGASGDDDYRCPGGPCLLRFSPIDCRAGPSSSATREARPPGASHLRAYGRTHSDPLGISALIRSRSASTSRPVRRLRVHRPPANPLVAGVQVSESQGAGRCGPVRRRSQRASIAAVTSPAAASRRAVPMSSRTSSRAAGIAPASASPLPTGKNGSARPCTTSVGSVSSPRR